ncbi:unnamed protein product [Malus baccata var. baccata]
MCFSNQEPLQPLSNTYSPAWRNSDHGSWNNIEALNQAFAPPSQQEYLDTTLVDTLKPLAQSTLQFQQSTSSMIQEHSIALTKLEIQLGQIVQALNEHQFGGDDQEEKEEQPKQTCCAYFHEVLELYEDEKPFIPPKPYVQPISFLGRFVKQ